MHDDIEEKLNTFFTQFKKQQYKKGEILIRADDDPAGIFYLQEGVVKQYAISKKGEELVLNVFKPIAFFPMGWAINDTKNDYYYEALTPVTVCKAPREKVVDFLKSHPDVLYNLVSRIYKGLDGLFTRMTYMMSGGAYDRLVTEILIQSKRFGTHHTVHPFGTDQFALPSGKTETNSVIELHVSEKELAAQVGMTRETVSREMRTLKEKGLVTFSKNILLIHSLVKLEAELG